MKYVGGDTGEPGCIFCSRLAGDDDVASLILLRGECAFSLMNLYPYNTGHLMIVPNAHVATLEDADPADVAAVAALLHPITRVLRRVLNPAGFNVGLNIGDVAGAGVAEHLHMHVVPRWNGDANFMPILASTMVMPELIPATYAKLRAEIERDHQTTGESAPIALVILDPTAEHVLIRRHAKDARLFTATPTDEEPVWRSAMRTLEEHKLAVSLVGWAGAARTGEQPPALAYVTSSPSTDTRTETRWITIGKAIEALSEKEAVFVRTAVDRIKPSLPASAG